MKFSVRIIFSVILILASLFLFKNSALAQQSYTSNNTNPMVQFTAPDINPDVPKNLNTLSQSILINVLSSLTCQLAGVNPTTPNKKCLGIDPNTGKLGFVENGGGVVGIMGSAITMLYIPPIHTADYVKYLAGNFGIANNAYAQAGTGLTSLSPVSGLWKIFRNIVYLLFIFIFVLIGVGIMLRVRIDPRTVMTIQNQIPKLIIGLILVTFSLAIAGFLIDLMWVIILVVFQILRSADAGISASTSAGSFVTPFGMSDIFGGFTNLAINTAAFVGNGIFSTFNVGTLGGPGGLDLPAGAAGGCNGFDPLCWIGQVISSTIGPIINALFGLIIGFIVGSIVFLVVIIAVIYSLFKLWFALLKAYISILLDIIFAPFWIIAGLLPGSGQKVGFEAWIRDLAGNLAAFPVTIGLFLIAKVFVDSFNSGYAGIFAPPLIGRPTSGGTELGNFGAVVAFGIIMMMPNVVNMTKAAFKAPESGIGLGGGPGVGIAAVGALGGSIKNRMYWRDPRDGSTHGPAAAVGRNVGEKMSNSGVGERAGRLTLPIRTNRLARLAWKPHERNAWNSARTGGGSREVANSARRAATDRTETTPPVTPEETQRAQREQADREG